jgi:Family of unknown function (DUF6065)
LDRKDDRVGEKRGCANMTQLSSRTDSRVMEAFALSTHSPSLVPAPAERDWMNAGGRHAYRCLPLTIGNSYGWQLLLPVDVTAEWNGGPSIADVSVTCARPHQAVSNFANGILTFDVGYIFRTPPDLHILVMGPSNTFKDGIAPMTAVVESDWLPYGFTMNYRFTRPGQVRWCAGEPFVQICIVSAGVQQDMQPVIRRLEDDQKLLSDRTAWRDRRARMCERLAARDPAALKDPWDKDYFVGRYADGRPTTASHIHKLRLRAPIDERS